MLVLDPVPHHIVHQACFAAMTFYRLNCHRGTASGGTAWIALPICLYRVHYHFPQNPAVLDVPFSAQLRESSPARQFACGFVGESFVRVCLVARCDQFVPDV